MEHLSNDDHEPELNPQIEPEPASAKPPKLNPKLSKLANLRGIERLKAWLECSEPPTTKGRIVEHAVAHGLIYIGIFIVGIAVSVASGTFDFIVRVIAG